MKTVSGELDINGLAAEVFHRFRHDASLMKGCVHDIDGAVLLDVGVEAAGGLAAGLGLARLCLGDLSSVAIVPAGREDAVDHLVTVATDHPVMACLAGQYAGWPVQVDDFFAMGSGPMRSLRGKEAMLIELGLATTATDSTLAVGVLETDRLPGENVLQAIAEQCGVPLDHVRIAVASSTSVAGSVQVVARTIETALHKLHALHFDVTTVVSAAGSAPLPPCARPGDTVGGIGRTNDAILYGGRVTLWIDADDDAIDAVAADVPSERSSDHGLPFAETFKQVNYDFYKVDPRLFSPAVVTIHSLRSGRSWCHGHVRPDVLRRSFGT